jgi:hypothetical protein
MDSESSIESIELNPNLFLEHKGSLFCGGEKVLVRLKGFCDNLTGFCDKFFNFIALYKRLYILNFYFPIADDDFENFLGAISPCIKKYLDVLERRIELLCGVIEQIFVVLLNQDYA